MAYACAAFLIGFPPPDPVDHLDLVPRSRLEATVLDELKTQWQNVSPELQSAIQDGGLALGPIRYRRELGRINHHDLRQGRLHGGDCGRRSGQADQPHDDDDGCEPDRPGAQRMADGPASSTGRAGLTRRPVLSNTAVPWPMLPCRIANRSFVR